MANEKPQPNIDFDIKPFWDGVAEHQFLLLYCKKCGACYWPVAYCRNHPNEPFMGEMEWRPASGKGKVFTFNIHYRAFDPAFKDDIPYIYALIELDEGPMFGTNIIGCKPEDVQVGAPVEIVFEDYVDGGYTLPKARLAGQ